MTKREILGELAQKGDFTSPDELRAGLRLELDRRSLYTYLRRLYRQGLLERTGETRGRLAYRLTQRGQARLRYLSRQEKRD